VVLHTTVGVLDQGEGGRGVAGGCLTLRDGGHSQSHGDLEVVDGTADPGASVDGVVEVANVDGPHGNADEGDDLGELLAELVHLSLEGGLLLHCGGHLVTDLTNLSGAAGGHGNTNSLAGGDVGALQTDGGGGPVSISRTSLKEQKNLCLCSPSCQYY